MTKRLFIANPDATNSELDAKVVIDHTKLSKDEEEKIIQDLMKEREDNGMQPFIPNFHD